MTIEFAGETVTRPERRSTARRQTAKLLPFSFCISSQQRRSQPFGTWDAGSGRFQASGICPSDGHAGRHTRRACTGFPLGKYFALPKTPKPFPAKPTLITIDLDTAPGGRALLQTSHDTPREPGNYGRVVA